MQLRSLSLAIVLCLSFSFAPSRGDEPTTDGATAEVVRLVEFLEDRANELDFYYTIENQVLEDGKSKQIELIADFPKDLKAKSASELVKQLNGKIEGVKVFQSPVEPAVIHLAYASLLKNESYPLDRKASLERYAGKLQGLPDLLGAALGGGIRSPNTIKFPVSFLGDFVTDVEVQAEKERVRDILTRATPLRGYNRLLWVSTYYHKESVAEFVYLGTEETREEEILREKGTAGYLEEMGRRLDCYFTVEDDMQEQFDHRASILDARRSGRVDFTIDDVDKLVSHLDAILNPSPDEGVPRRVKAMRSDFDDRVVHLMRESLSEGEYVLDEKIDFDVWANLAVVPYRLGQQLNGRIDGANKPRLPQVTTGYHPYVSGTFQNTSVRQILTELSPQDGQRRIIWASSRFVIDKKPKVFVAYYGVTEEVSEALGYDQGKPPSAP